MECKELGVKLFFFCGGETLTKSWVLKNIESLCEGSKDVKTRFMNVIKELSYVRFRSQKRTR